MLCELCGKKEAAIRITEKVEGVQRVRLLCEECWRADRSRTEAALLGVSKGVRCPDCQAYVPAADVLCPNCLGELPGGSFDIKAYRRRLSFDRGAVVPGIKALGGLLLVFGMGLVAFMMVSQGGFLQRERFVISWRETLIAAELALLGVIVFAAGLGLLCLRPWAHWLSFWGAAFLMMVCIWQVLAHLQQGVLDPQAGLYVGGWLFALLPGFVLALLVVEYLSRPEVKQQFGK